MSPAGAYSRRYCGGGDAAACEQLLRETLLQAIAEPAAITMVAMVATVGEPSPMVVADSDNFNAQEVVGSKLLGGRNRRADGRTGEEEGGHRGQAGNGSHGESPFMRRMSWPVVVVGVLLGTAAVPARCTGCAAAAR